MWRQEKASMCDSSPDNLHDCGDTFDGQLGTHVTFSTMTEKKVFSPSSRSALGDMWTYSSRKSERQGALDNRQ